MPKSRVLKKSLCLKQEALKRLEIRLHEQFGECPTHSALARSLNIDRETISKIRNRRKGVVFSKIEILFGSVDLDVDEVTDCEPPTEIAKSSVNRASKSSEIPIRKQVQEALAKINYRNQVKTYSDFVYECPHCVGAFFVGGKAYSGQRWLVNRVIREFLPDIGSANKIIISPRSGEICLEDVWRQLGDRLLRNPHIEDAELLVEALCQLWEDDHVALVLRDVDRLTPQEVQKFLETLWTPLVDRLFPSASTSPYSFLIFLVDNYREVDTYGVEIDSCINHETPTSPVALPIIQPFKPTELRPWIDKHRGLPRLLPQPKQLNQVAERIWREGLEGIPELTMKAICDRIDSDRNLWFEIQDSLEF
ncbi:MAG: hypothetical protein WBA57_00130 [Elainellaceae cyanobacterium]